MTKSKGFRPSIEFLEAREVPALLAPIPSQAAGGVLLSADFNHDQRDDVLLLVSSKSLAVQINNGDGTFRSATNLRVQVGELGTFLGGPSVSDVNGDGHLDVTATSFTRNSGSMSGFSRTAEFNVWFGKGNGRFARARVSSMAFDWAPWPPQIDCPSVVQTDLNRDGIADLARVNTSTNSVDVLLGNGNGTYQAPRTFAAASSPGSIAVGDFNGDGWTDLVVVNTTGTRLSVLLNDGNW